MSFTNTKARTLKDAIDLANPGEFASVMQRAKFGTRETILKRDFTGLVGAASFDLTAIDSDTEKTAKIDGASNPNRLPVKHCRTCRVTAATTGTFVGTYVLTDVAGDMLTAATHTVVGIARISDDGKTITFPTADVTAFIIEYSPGGRADGGFGTPWPEALADSDPLG